MAFCAISTWREVSLCKDIWKRFSYVKDYFLVRIHPALCQSLLQKSRMSSGKMKNREAPMTQLVQPPEGSQSSALLHHVAFNFIYTLLPVLISQDVDSHIVSFVCWCLGTGSKPCHCSPCPKSQLICLVSSFFLLILTAIPVQSLFRDDLLHFALVWTRLWN